MNQDNVLSVLIIQITSSMIVQLLEEDDINPIQFMFSVLVLGSSYAEFF